MNGQIVLPDAFQSKIIRLLGTAEAQQFFDSYQDPPVKGLRFNPLKLPDKDNDRLAGLIDLFSLRPVPWCKTGFYYPSAVKPGKSPYHEAGAYYIQEPSAMFAGETLKPSPGERVLDLCAAPGGKSTHLAAFLARDGVLVANEPYSKRCQVLAQNLERMGVQNAIVTQNEPSELAAVFSEWFDAILVDAPCSGEGMFRKDPESIAEWSPESVLICENRQLDILRHASTMLKSGGRLLYSTCTFSPEENEQLIEQFLNEHPNFELLSIDIPGLSAGRPEWSEAQLQDLNKCTRFWPHIQEGEGHFVAILVKTAADAIQKNGRTKKALARFERVKSNEQQIVSDWMQEHLHTHSRSASTPEGSSLSLQDDWLDRNHRVWLKRNQHIYLGFSDLPAGFEKLQIVRPGLWMGELKPGRFEPSHSLAMALIPQDVRNTFELLSDDDHLAQAYLRGETIERDHPMSGWILLTYDGFSIGWGKQSGRILKNHFPKGLRWA